MEYLSVDEKIYWHRILIRNGMNDSVISSKMACYSYTEENMKQASLMHQEVEEANRQNHFKYGDYNKFKDKLKKAKKAFHKDYITDLEFARIALADQPGILDRIAASGRRQKALAAYLSEAKWFYRSLTDEETLIHAMAVYGYTREIILQRLAGIENLYLLMEQIAKASGEAQHMTQVRNRKLRELDRWASKYKKVARLAFRDSPQYLEKLGIVVKSGTGRKD